MKITKLPDIDDVSSESSLSESDYDKRDIPGVNSMDSYLSEYYNNAYQMFEMEAKQRNFVVDLYNFNLNN